jgi:O-phospho-L-seryl-tRNASec:L-selenocysteinyl-tRNA synthase
MWQESNQKLAAGLVDASYIRQGAQSLQQRAKLVKSLLSHRRIPQEPWSDANVEALLLELSAMDSNNFEGSVGLGEREARIASPLLRKYHLGFGHGIGRSGEIAAVQPKAAGSSLIAQLTNCLVLHALHISGLSRLSHCITLPMATGMSLLMVFLALKAEKPDAKWVGLSDCSRLVLAQSTFPCVDMLYGSVSTKSHA